ncbi:DUF3303 family protein [Thermoproteota archaeon]
MKFIAFLECGTEDLDKLIDIWNKRLSDKHTMKTIYPPHTIADSPRGYKGFTIFETDDIEDIMHYVTEYDLVAKIKVYPIWESKKSTVLYKKIRAGL